MKTKNIDVDTNCRTYLRDPALFFGLLFLMINLLTSYMFYHVNSLKILLVLISVSLLTLVGLWPSKWLLKQQPPLLVWGIISAPLLMTLPGFLLQGGVNNYNFNYELVSNLILILWAGFFYQAINTRSSIHIFLCFIGGCIIVASVWSLTSKFGFNPLDNTGDIKASFGNRNYFAGFLIIFLPILFSLVIPPQITGRINIQGRNLLYVTAIIFAALTLFVIQSRAAIVGALVSNSLVILISILGYTGSRERKKIFILRFFFLILIAVVIFFILYKLDLVGGKWRQVLSAKKWLGRTIPWRAAYDAIKAAPWFGHGLGSSYNLFFRFVTADARLFWYGHSFNHVHSEYLEYLEEAGLIGGLLFLIFWIYLAVQLYKLIKNSATPFVFRLSAGIAGGFVAYLIQSIFSVAPRMMVVKLPLFTLFALVFVLKKVDFTAPESRFFSSKSLRVAGNCLPVFVILTLSWVLYLPWMEGQYNFVKISSSRSSIIQLKQLKELVKKRRDIYALSSLAHKQISYKRWPDLRKTTEIMDQVIPYYRDLGYIKILLAKMEGDFARAIIDGRDSQAHDRYFIPSIKLLLEIALREKDEALFFDELAILTRFLVFKSKLQKDNREDSVEVKKNQTDFLLTVADKSDKLSITWGADSLKKLMDIGHKNLSRGRWDIQEREEFFNTTVQAIMGTPYFRDSVQYIFLKNRQNKKLIKLKTTREAELTHSTEPGQIQPLKQGQLERQKYYNKMQENEQEYINRKRFGELIIKNLLKTLFPLHLAKKG